MFPEIKFTVSLDVWSVMDYDLIGKNHNSIIDCNRIVRVYKINIMRDTLLVNI